MMALAQTPPADYLQSLNPEQLKAATAPILGRVIILAGPGTGKTKTISARIAWLIHDQGVSPESIIALTFTNAAASELISRVGSAGKRVMAGTFHGFCAKLLYKFGKAIGLKSGFTIADEAISKRLMKTIFSDKEFENSVKKNLHFKKVKETYVNSKTNESHTVSKILNIISKIKGDGYTIETWANSGFNQSQFVLKAFRHYDDLLKQANALDFDDLLLYGVELFETLPGCVNPKCVLIDEYQDTNKVQFKLMCLLVGPETGLTVVGDPDQSIYKFRGAEPKNFDEMKLRYPNFYECHLTTNYRSAQPILDACIKLINVHRSPEEERSLNAFIKVPTLVKPIVGHFSSFSVEASAIAKEIRFIVDNFSDHMEYKDVAILFRNRWRFRAMEYALLNENIPYAIKGSNTLLDSVEISTVLNYLKIIESPFQDDALLNTINKPARYVGSTTIDRLSESNFSYKNMWEKVEALTRNKLEFGPISSKSYNGVVKYHGIVQACRDRLAKSDTAQDVSDVIDYIINETKLVDYVHQNNKKEPDTITSNLKMLKQLVMNLETSNNYQALASMYDGQTPPTTSPSATTFNDEKSDLRIKSDCLNIFLREISLKASVPATTEGNPNRVVLSTIHMAKGLEWKTVFVPNLSECHIYGNDEDEERRVFFVSLSRAELLLYMSYSDISEYSENFADTFVDTYLTPELLKLCVATKEKFGSKKTCQSFKELFGTVPVEAPTTKKRKRKLGPLSKKKKFTGGFRSAAAVLEDTKAVNALREEIESKKTSTSKRQKTPASASSDSKQGTNGKHSIITMLRKKQEPETTTTKSQNPTSIELIAIDDSSSAPTPATKLDSDEIQVMAVKTTVPLPALAPKTRKRKSKAVTGNSSITDHFKPVKKQV